MVRLYYYAYKREILVLFLFVDMNRLIGLWFFGRPHISHWSRRAVSS